MNESYTKSPKFCKVHKVSNGVALHHVVTHFRTTCKGSTPASISVHRKDVRFSKILLPEQQWDKWSAYGQRKAQRGFFCSSLWSPAWTLILVTTRHPAVVTQMSGVKWGCVLWQKVDLLLTKGDAHPREIPQMHHCNNIPSDLLPGSPSHCKEINVHRKRSVPWAPGVMVQCDSETHWGHCQFLPLVSRERSLLGDASGVFLNQK